jgi:hypothetical protein
MRQVFFSKLSAQKLNKPVSACCQAWAEYRAYVCQKLPAMLTAAQQRVPELTDLCEDKREVLCMRLTIARLILQLSEKGVVYIRLLARRMSVEDANFTMLASMLPSTRKSIRGNKKEKVAVRPIASNQDKGKKAAAAGRGEGGVKGQESVADQADAGGNLACTPAQTVSSRVSTRLL